jgi:hypothetical protein
MEMSGGSGNESAAEQTRRERPASVASAGAAIAAGAEERQLWRSQTPKPQGWKRPTQLPEWQMDPRKIAKLRRQRERAALEKQAYGLQLTKPDRRERRGRRLGPGEYLASHTSPYSVQTLDPRRPTSSMESTVQRCGLRTERCPDPSATLQKVELSMDGPSAAEYDVLSYTDLKSQVKNPSLTLSSFTKSYERFDEPLQFSNYRYSTDHQPPEVRFSMQKQMKAWDNVHAPRVGNAKRPEIWHSEQSLGALLHDGADAFYKQKPSFVKSVKKMGRPIDYDKNGRREARFPACVTKHSEWGGRHAASSTKMGPGDYEIKREGASVQNPEMEHSMFRSSTTREPLFCQHPKLLLDTGF